MNEHVPTLRRRNLALRHPGFDDRHRLGCNRQLGEDAGWWIIGAAPFVCIALALVVALVKKGEK